MSACLSLPKCYVNTSVIKKFFVLLIQEHFAVIIINAILEKYNAGMVQECYIYLRS